jgi:hypothetical protein
MIRYLNKDYLITVLEVKPDNPAKAVSIIETDINVEFMAPPDATPEQARKVDQPIAKAEEKEKPQKPKDKSSKKEYY